MSAAFPTWRPDGAKFRAAKSSAIHVMESQMGYILRYLDEVDRQPKGSALDVRPDRQRAYNEWLQRRLKTTAWNSGCRSWYLDRAGRNTTMYPGLTFAYRRRMANLRSGGLPDGASQRKRLAYL